MATPENNQIKNQQIIQAFIGHLNQARLDQSSSKVNSNTTSEFSSNLSIDPRLQSLLYFNSLSPQNQLLYAQLLGISNVILTAPQRIAQLVALQSFFQNAHPNVNNMYFHNTINTLNNINLNLTNCAHPASDNSLNDLRYFNENTLNSQNKTNLKEYKTVSNESAKGLNLDSSLFSDISESDHQQKYLKKDICVRGII